MTEESGPPPKRRPPRSTPPQEQAPPLVQVPEHPVVLDWMLQILVHTVNSTDAEYGVTLNMGGVIVTGTLVSGRKYFEGVAEEFAAASTSKRTAAYWRRTFRQLGDTYFAPIPADQPVTPPHFFHLRDARFIGLAPPVLPSNRGVWWRGRIVRVDGFFLGTLAGG